MFEILIPMFLGWPAMIVSLALAFVGVLSKKPEFSTAGGILLLPPAWYLSHYSLIYAILPMLIFGSAYAVSKGKTTRAFILVAPVLVAIGGLGIVVLTQ
jgi:peptidoglycan/LPS O-acetylase OafA/YrhL